MKIYIVTHESVMTDNKWPEYCVRSWLHDQRAYCSRSGKNLLVTYLTIPKLKASTFEKWLETENGIAGWEQADKVPDQKAEDGWIG
jgi:hypothetical protein